MRKSIKSEELDRYIKEIKNYGALDLEIERNLFRDLKSADEKIKGKAQEEIIGSQLHMVVKILNTFAYIPNNVDIMDLVFAGNAGIVEALGRFDIDKNNRFSTYCYWWIWVKIKDAINTYGRSIKYPTGVMDKFYNHKAGNDEESSKYSDLAIQALNQDIISLESDISGRAEDGNLLKYIDVIEDPNAEMSNKNVLDKEIYSILREELSRLKEDDIDILKSRYINDDRMLLEELGEKYNVTKERIRQKEFKSLRLLKRRLVKRYR